MLTLGLAGGLDPVHEARLDTPENFTYDGAAVLVEDGTVVAAVEEARLDRINRSNKFPTAAIRFCLEKHGVRPEDLDRIAYYAQEEKANVLLSRLYMAMPEVEPRLDARQMLAATLGRELRSTIDPARLCFFQHKLTHAAGAMAQSGFDDALVLILDNSGGLFLGRREEGGATTLEEIGAMPPSNSTTRLFQSLLPFLGVGPLDWQQAMSMATEGDPAVFRPLLRSLYELLPDGGYNLCLDQIGQVLAPKVQPRGKDGPGQQHRDLAASLQEGLEEITLHVLRHHRAATGRRNLCLAGGMVENSTTNGKVLSSGLFDAVFVHPSVSDAGCALGAALLASEAAGRPAPRRRIEHVYWGWEPGVEALAAELERWRGFLAAERLPDIARRTAELLAAGALVGWVQGRSEFSPRALGNRSVLADPRPPENRSRIDAALRRRAGSVAVGPSVLEEAAGDLFELPEGTASFPYMAFALKVREAARPVIAATLNADGTAWPQTVSEPTNPRFWELLRAFCDLTGVPALLNTSFRSHGEPIVDSVEDAVVAFLTTELDYLVVGDFLVERRTPSRADRLSLRLSLPPYVRLQQTRRFVGPERMAVSFQIGTTYDANLAVPISRPLYELLMGLEGERPLSELLPASAREGADPGDTAADEALLSKLEKLWSQRLVRLRGGGGEGTAGK